MLRKECYRQTQRSLALVMTLIAMSVASCSESDPAPLENHVSPKPSQTSSLPSAGSRIDAYSTLMPDQRIGPLGTPAGNGVITDEVGMPIEAHTGNFVPSTHAWFQQKDDQTVIVYAGRAAADPDQGVVIVVRSGTISDPIGAWIESPTKSGGFSIVGAEGERLILEADPGEIYYFDVPGGQFASSLTEEIPTMTPGPTPSPSATIAGLQLDDAPDSPGLILQASQPNTDLRFAIDKPSDEDWFLFRLESTKSVRVSLTDPPEEVGLYVYRASDTSLVASNTEAAAGDKIISIPQAQPDEYYIRVVGLFSGTDHAGPYVLRFETR